MNLAETSKFRKLRKRIRQEQEKKELKRAVKKISQKPSSGKKLKGEFKELRSFEYKVLGQSKRLIYKVNSDTITLLSFGPREGIYK